jgi:hypothetical protein
MAFNPQANYTDWATTTGLGISVPTFVDKVVLHGQRNRTPAAINFSFPDRSRYFSFQVAPHLRSRG